MIYVDSSALVKLAHAEQHSEALVQWLASRSDQPAVTSALARTETRRALRRSDPAALQHAPMVFSRLFFIPIEDRVLELAGELGAPEVRTLDAIHLATAVLLGVPGLSFVTYDKRLQAAASEYGFETPAPA